MWEVAELVPHKGSMSLLDDVQDTGPDWVKTSVRISEDILFFQASKGVPAWVGIEYMAQTIALYIGLAARKAGGEPQMGFLLGTRHYNSKAPCFSLGEKLIIHVVEEWKDDQMGVFNCNIQSNGKELAEARLNVFQPSNIEDFIKGKKE